MNSTLIKVAIAYIAGIGTYHLFQSSQISGDLKSLNMQIMALDSGINDTTKAALYCPCDNEGRYNVDPREPSMNSPIPTIPECTTMVHNGNPNTPSGGTPVGAGAWF